MKEITLILNDKDCTKLCDVVLPFIPRIGETISIDDYQIVNVVGVDYFVYPDEGSESTFHSIILTVKEI